MAVQLAEGVLKSRESSSSTTWDNIMVEVSPNVDTETVASNFAAPYVSTNTYNKNDTCIHDNYFYTCKQNGVTGNWDSTKWELSTAGGIQNKLLSLHDDLGIVIDGNKPSMAVTSGQYVIVRNSTISGITDGLYKANAALSTSTDVTAANLTAVTGGGLNALNDNFTWKLIRANMDTNSYETLRGYNEYLIVLIYGTIIIAHLLIFNGFSSNLSINGTLSNGARKEAYYTPADGHWTMSSDCTVTIMGR